MTIFIVGQKKYRQSIGDEFDKVWRAFIGNFNRMDPTAVNNVAEEIKILVGLLVRKMMNLPDKSIKNGLTALITELTKARKELLMLKSGRQFAAGKKKIEDRIKDARALIQVVGKEILAQEEVTQRMAKVA